MKTQQEIRKSFLDFFESKGHKIVSSSPVIPKDDPTLLFANAGMNQFKPYFLGSEQPEFTKVADTQKCLRVSGKHNDLDAVGNDTYHHTFFEMLGNWSFGDYFKKESIMYAWEFLTVVCGFDKSKLYATYFGGDKEDGLQADDEARDIWKNCTDIDNSHILPFGKKDNFWEMGEVGPCGPCSEIHIDLGSDMCDKKDDPNHVCGVNGDCRRFMEIWNLVFMQLNRNKDKSLSKLNKNNIDTGMGFERLTALLQGKKSNYDTDLFTPILDKLTEITGVKYGSSDSTDVAMRVCADHIKALCFAISDGARPDKKGRGSVLRSLLRRASRFGSQRLGMKEPFLYKLPKTVADIYSDIFPEVLKNVETISDILKEEEILFGKTLEQGLLRFNELIEKAGSNNVLDGFDAYRLYHQDGFPKDLILQMASEHGKTIDEDSWEKAEKEHRERSKGEAKEALLDPQVISDLPATEFIGYWESGKSDHDGTEAEVKPLRMIGESFLILESTPFYAQSGGQIGDTGIITGENFEFKVTDTKKIGNFHIHCGILENGDSENLPEKVFAKVDHDRRKALMSSHTATHILQWALREVLGEQVAQKGSEVSPELLRFDFRHPKQMTKEEIERTEILVNKKIMENTPLVISWKSLEEAKKDNVTALFGEKYGKTVRVIDIGGYSKELCGGTHCKATGDIGSFKIMSESSSEAGVRRIEAITGMKAFEESVKDRNVIKELSSMLVAPREELAKKIEALNAKVKEMIKEREKESKKGLEKQSEDIFKSAEEVNGVKVTCQKFSEMSADNLATLATLVKGHNKVCGLFISVQEQTISLVGFASKDIAAKDKVNIGNYVREASKILGGGGGGKFDFAKGGGKNPEKVEEALEKTKVDLTSFLTEHTL